MARYRLGWHENSYLDYVGNLDDARKRAVQIYNELPSNIQKIVPSMKIYVGKKRYGEISVESVPPLFHKDYAYYSPAPFDPKTGKMINTYSYRVAKKTSKRR